VANHWLPGSTATLRTHPKCPEMTRTSFQGAWYVGLIVRVVLCKVSACERVDEDVRVDCLWAGVESIDAIMREASAVAEWM
jgi:hypothetical protein